MPVLVSLSVKAALVYLALGGLGVLVIAFATYLLVGSMLQQKSLGEIVSRIEEQGSHQMESVDSMRVDVQSLAGMPPVAGIVRATQTRGYDAQDKTSLDAWKARLEIIFRSFMLSHYEYTKIRFIGVADGGRELVRVDKAAQGKINLVSAKNLQRKGDADYFIKTAAWPCLTVWR